MSRKLLSEAEIASLKAHPGVENVTERVVIFTPEFKRKVHSRMTAGEDISDILETEGIDVSALGQTRINGMREKLRKYASRVEGFERRSSRDRRKTEASDMSRSQSAAAADSDIQSRLKRLEHELAYARQEIEFVKKIQMADTEARRTWESKHRRA